MTKLGIFSFLFLIAAFSSILFLSNQVNDDPVIFNQKVSPPPLPLSASFAGEEVPLNKLDVKEHLERELLSNVYFHSQTFHYIKLANRWLPIIEPILKENGIHDDFKYLAIAESGLQNVVSSAQAVGVWQFREGTATDYGLEVNDYVDERYHLEKATAAACEYFKKAHKEFQSWSMAAASYNCGVRRLREASEEQQVNNYYDLYLNTETGRYVYRIIAFKEILSNPEKYGFYVSAENLYQPIAYKAILVDSSIADLPAFSRANGTTYKMLKKLNPWLRKTSLRNLKDKEYIVKIPLEE